MTTALVLLPLLQAASQTVSQTATYGTEVPGRELGTLAWLITTVLKLLVFFVVILLTVAYATLAERKIAGWAQDRHGPNRVGPWGLLQPIADGVKNFLKEETLPKHVNRALFILAPAIALMTALMTWAVIPFGAAWDSPWGRVDMALAPLPVGYLYVLAIASLGVYGIVLAGWSSNNKYALLGGLRSSAQMVSYEIAMGMSIIPVLLLSGNVALASIVQQQATIGWNVLNLTVAFFIFMIAAFAETNRLPFDLPEAESELVAGYHAEYSSMKFSVFFIAEYANLVTSSALMATLFFGGWDIPFLEWDNLAPHTGLKTLLTTVFFYFKILFFVFVFMWVRWTLPRFRYDQLMALGWRFMLPLALGYIVLIAAAVVALDAMGVPHDWRWTLALLALNIVLCIGLFFVFDRGRIISPASSRIAGTELDRLRRAAELRARQSTITPQAGD